MINKIWLFIEKNMYLLIHETLKLEISEKAWFNFVQFVKFGLVGVLNNMICYVTYVLLIILDIHYIVANVVGFSASVCNSFYWNNKYVFVSEKKRVWWKNLFKTYISYAGTGIVLSNIFLMVWIDILHISEIVAPIINLFLMIPLNFLLNKFWVYRK